MNAANRIIDEFDRLVAMGPDKVAHRPISERIVYYVVADEQLVGLLDADSSEA